MIAFGERLRAERERLGLTQAEFSALGGVGRNAQRRYETDERAPDSDYLTRIADAGADILYIVTGRPSPVAIENIAGVLSDRSRPFEGPPSGRANAEAALLLMMRQLKDEELGVLRRMLEGLTRPF